MAAWWPSTEVAPPGSRSFKDSISKSIQSWLDSGSRMGRGPATTTDADTHTSIDRSSHHRRACLRRRLAFFRSNRGGASCCNGQDTRHYWRPLSIDDGCAPIPNAHATTEFIDQSLEWHRQGSWLLDDLPALSARRRGAPLTLDIAAHFAPSLFVQIAPCRVHLGAALACYRARLVEPSGSTVATSPCLDRSTSVDRFN